MQKAKRTPPYIGFMNAYSIGTGFVGGRVCSDQEDLDELIRVFNKQTGFITLGIQEYERGASPIFIFWQRTDKQEVIPNISFKALVSRYQTYLKGTSQWLKL